MRVHVLAGIILVLTAMHLLAAEPQESSIRSKRILASDFPKTAARVMSFEDRINSKDSSVRAEVLTEVGYFYSLPDSDYVGFLRAMYQDPDPLVRGRAINKLYGMWVPQEPEKLPLVFTGYHDGQLVDRRSKTAIPDLMAQCSEGGCTGGYAAYVLGMLRVEEAIPLLKKLRADSNIFVRYTAGRALLDCGDKSTAIAIFDDISSTQLVLYASGRTTTTEDQVKPYSPPIRLVDPCYAAGACRGLIAIGGDEERKGLKRLIELMGFLERSKDANDQNALNWVRNMLAVLKGQYFTTSAEASEWITQEQSGTGKPEPVAPVGAGKPHR